MRTAQIMTVCFMAMLGLLVLCGPANAVEGLISHWAFDEGTEDTAYDSVDGNHGTIYGATWATGKVGSALSFDGLDDYVVVPNDDSLNLSDGMTIAAWIRVDSTSMPNVIVSKWNDNTWDHSYIFKVSNADSRLRIELSRGYHNNLASLYGATPITGDDWTHVAATFDSSTVKLYVNGIEDGSKSAVGTISSSETELLIGAVPTGGEIRENYHGCLDEVGIYNRALTAVEIAELAGTSPNPTELIDELVEYVLLLNLIEGIENSLDAKLGAALNALDDLNENNDVAAINSMQAFINAVEAQSDNKISDEDADALIAAADEIIALLSGS